MKTSNPSKRLWLTFGVVLGIPALLILGIKMVSPLVSYHFNANLNDMQWTGKEAWMLFEDHRNGGVERLITPQGKIMKEGSIPDKYFHITALDSNLAAVITSTNPTSTQPEQVELIVKGELVPVPLPAEAFYVNNLSLSPDKQFLLLHSLQRVEDGTDFYFTHQAWVRNQTTQTWTQVAANQTLDLDRSQQISTEWVAKDPHTLFVQLQDPPNNGPHELAHFSYDAVTQILTEVDLHAPYGPLKAVSNIYGELGSDGPVQSHFELIGKNTLTFDTTVSNPRELLHWWNLGLFAENFSIVDLGQHKLVMKFKTEAGILDTNTGQFAKLMDVPYDSQMSVYTLEVVPSGFE